MKEITPKGAHYYFPSLPFPPPHLINEGDQHHSLPFLLLSVQVSGKFHRIEALQHRVLILHQALVCPGEEGLAGRRQHCQQLLVGQGKGCSAQTPRGGNRMYSRFIAVVAIAIRIMCFYRSGMSFMSETNGV